MTTHVPAPWNAQVPVRNSGDNFPTSLFSWKSKDLHTM